MDLKFVENLKRQWMTMIDAIDDPLVIVDSHYQIIRQNKAYVLRSGKGKNIKEFKNQKCYQVFAGRTSPCDHCQMAKVFQGKKSDPWTTGDLFPETFFEVRVHPIDLKDAAEKWFVVHYRDLTEQRRMQDSLAMADKLAGLGRLASGVAHELNSPLAGVLAFAQVLLSEVDANDPKKEDLLQIEAGAKKCKAIVEDMLRLARPDKFMDRSLFKPVNIIETVQCTLRFISHLLKKSRVQLHQEIPKGTFWVLGMENKLEQVFLNLLTNAIQAMEDQEDGGVLNLTYSFIEKEKNLTPENAQGFIRIHIADSGSGIDTGLMGKIFDPFFTTKPVGEGTGLGLSICHNIVKKHGGDISVESQKHMGSTFTVILPLQKIAQ